jgi:hypothetical protein
MAGNLDLKLKIRALVQGIDEVKRLAGEVKGLAGTAGKKIPDPTDQMRGGLGATASSLRGLATQFGAFLAAIGAYKAIAAVASGVSALVSEGVRYNSVMESSRLGIASLITAQAQLRDSGGNVLEGQEALTAATGIADEQLKKLRIANLETIATFEQLAKGFQIGLGPGLAAGLNLDQVRELTVSLTQAAGAIDPVLLDERQLGQEIRSIFDGTINQTTRVANTLGLTAEKLQEWKDQGPDKYFENLSKALAAFNVAGARGAQTWAGLTSNMRDALSMQAGDITKPLFDQVKKALLDAFGEVFKGGEVAKEFQGIGTALRDAATVAGGLLADGIRAAVDGAAKVAAWMEENKDQIALAARSAADLVRETGTLLALIVQTNAEAGTIRPLLDSVILVLRAASLLVAGLHDGFRLIGAVVVGIGVELVRFVNDPLALIMRGIAAAGEATGVMSYGAAASLRGAADSLTKATDGLEEAGAVWAGKILEDFAEGNTESKKLIDTWMRGAKTPTLGAAPSPLLGGVTVGSKPGTSPADKANAEAVNELVAALKKKAEAIDETNAAEVIALLHSKQATPQQIAEARAYLAAAAAKKASKEASAEASKQAEQDKRAVDSLLASLEKEVATYGLGKGALVQYELAARHAGDTEKALAKSRTDALQNMENQAAIEKTIAALREEALTVGYTERQLQLYKFAMQDGVTPAQIAQADALLAEKEHSEQLIQVKKDLVELANQQRTALEGEVAGWLNAIDPMKQYRDQLRDLSNAQRQGLISGVDAERVRTHVEMEQWKAEFPDLAKAAQDAAQGMQGAFETFFYDPMKMGLKGLLAAFVDMIRKIVAQWMAAQMTNMIMGMFGGGGGGGGGAAAGVLVHSGGVIGGGGLPTKSVSPWAFVGAPRLHAGALLGLGRDEVPAILQTGEEVLSRSDARNRANGGLAGPGAAPGAKVRVVNVWDPSIISDHMNGAEGEKIVLNIIRKNRSGVAQLVSQGS